MSAIPVLDITITVDGVEHRGNWFTFDGAIYVRSGLGNRSTWYSGPNAAPLAELLLSEIVRDAS
jgi:hypothetical protein